MGHWPAKTATQRVFFYSLYSQGRQWSSIISSTVTLIDVLSCRNKKELAHPGNKGLDIAVALLKPIKEKYASVTWAGKCTFFASLHLAIPQACAGNVREAQPLEGLLLNFLATAHPNVSQYSSHGLD